MERPSWAAPRDDMEFWENFIRIYRANPILWWTKYDKATDLLKKKNARSKAVLELLDYCNSVRTDIDKTYINATLKRIRGSYLKQYKLAKKIGKTFQSRLLFYDKLSFLVCEEENDVDVLNEIKNVFLRQLQIKSPIEKVFTTVDLKTHAPTFIPTSSTALIRSKQSPIKISNTTQLSESNGSKSLNIKLETYDEPSTTLQYQIIRSDQFSKNKISKNVQLSKSSPSQSPNIKIEICDSEDFSMSSQNKDTEKKGIIVKQEETEDPNLFIESYDNDDFVEIDLVDDSFICQESNTNEYTQKNKRFPENCAEDQLTKSSCPKKQCTDANSVTKKPRKLTNTSTLLRETNDFDQKSDEHEIDPFARDVSLNLESLDPHQKIYAKKIINEIFYYGKLNILTEKSRLLP